MIILGAGVLCITATAFGQFESKMREPGTPVYHTEVIRYPTANADSSRITVYVKMPYDNLQFVKFDSVYRAKYEISLVLFDREGIQADSRIDRQNIEVESFEATNRQDIFDVSQFSFQLHNSVYKLSVGLMDLDTRKTTYRKHTIDLKSFGEGAVQISDLLIVDQTIGQSPDSTTRYVPNVTNILDDSQKDFYLYFTVAGNEGPAFVKADILDTDGNKVQSQRDTISVSAAPTEVLMKMPGEHLRYNRYKYRVRFTQGDEESERTKDFRVGWVGMSNYISNLDKAIDQMVYIISSKKINNMKNAKPEEKKRLFTEYWDQKDPSPQTDGNELMNEYFRRVSYATEQFGSSIREGWRTDMGMVYILFGTPNDIERHPFDLGNKPYQIWYYFDINRQFVFVDDSGFGDYRLVTPLYDTHQSAF
ncbi:MAG: GWxTD domain-containing protein [Candidatus Marinimicrobia bacterium]|nr:GWxTD domain-containing protein [Candidatus Neomarinimicrobiota bacterium]